MRPGLIVALACALSIALGAWIALVWRAWRERAAGRARQERGARGERQAEGVLKAHGYAIVGRQTPLRYALEVDGEPREATLIADFIVERDGETLVAEVKTGNFAPRVERAETRRQLLEYHLASGARCVLLVDSIAQTVSEVAFPIAAHAQSSGRASGVGMRVSAVVLVLVCAAAWYASRGGSP